MLYNTAFRCVVIHHAGDQIQLVITERESIVYKLKEHEKDIENKVISLNDSATWELFKKLDRKSVV